MSLSRKIATQSFHEPTIFEVFHSYDYVYR